ncbi:MAG: phenylalanine--tRNA ligase subunit beta [Candidatus Thalassarchaeaceae archaeon]|nr:phenylalanine--tRNA ligase subunit beta [Candidatus Thalassarchaeaceae archaeon]
MPTIELSHESIRYIQKLNGASHEPFDWSEWLPIMGCPVDVNNEDTIEIEVFPDRPDLLSHETMAKASRSFLGIGKTEVDLDIHEGDIDVIVDSSLAEVRPVIRGAIVRGVDIGSDQNQTDGFIQSLMDHQEKLHMTLGRRRHFASIGVHDLSSINPPFRVLTVPSEYSFLPLAGDEEMTIAEILEEHPKGAEYAHLMEGLDRFPVILDADDRVLSFPPIINGSHTTVNSETRDFFIDVTGWDERACDACLLLICLSLSERCGKVESVKIIGDASEVSSPRGDHRVHRVPDRLIKKILGLSMESGDLAESLEKMGGRLDETRTVTDGPNEYQRWSDCAVGEKEHIVSMPRWRSDIMHPIDIIEDIAIGYGFENLPMQMSSLHLDAVPLKSSQLRRRFGESMRACGLQEVQSLTLSNERDQFSKMRWGEIGGTATIANPITSEHTILRQSVLPSLLGLLAANRHHELPQRVYELGTVVRDVMNMVRGSWACAEVGSGFSSAKGIAQAVLRDMGAELSEVEFQALEPGFGPWIPGRGASVSIRGEVIGEFGEIAPEVGLSFGLKCPIHAGEFDLEMLGRLIPDPVI